MPLAHAPGAITFAVCISPHMSEVEPGPDYPLHMPNLACASFGTCNSLACHYLVHILYLYLLLIHTIGKPFIISFPDAFEPPSRLPPSRDIEHKTNFLNPNTPI